MHTVYTTRTSVTTSYGSRDPVGRKYLDNGAGVILTTEDGTWMIAIDSQDTNYTTNRQYSGLTWDDVSANTWDSMSSMTWDELYTGLKPSVYTVRTPI